MVSCRVRNERNGGAWCPKEQINPETIEWIQVDLDTPKLITALETQGRYGSGHGLEYPPGYMLEYWRPDLNHWVRYKNRKGEEVDKWHENLAQVHCKSYALH